jgi:hypothetical protein
MSFAATPRLVLGRASSAALPVIYDEARGQYLVLDEGTGDLLYEYDTIAALMEDWLAKTARGT